MLAGLVRCDIRKRVRIFDLEGREGGKEEGWEGDEDEGVREGEGWGGHLISIHVYNYRQVLHCYSCRLIQTKINVEKNIYVVIGMGV